MPAVRAAPLWTPPHSGHVPQYSHTGQTHVVQRRRLPGWCGLRVCAVCCTLTNVTWDAVGGFSSKSDRSVLFNCAAAVSRFNPVCNPAVSSLPKTEPVLVAEALQLSLVGRFHRRFARVGFHTTPHASGMACARACGIACRVLKVCSSHARARLALCCRCAQAREISRDLSWKLNRR